MNVRVYLTLEIIKDRINMTHTIRESGWPDVPKLLRVQGEIACETAHLATSRDRRNFGLRTIVKMWINRRRVRNFIVEDEGRIVGYLTYISGKFPKVSRTAYIVMGVLASHRKRGIGSALLRRVEEYARASDMHRLELEVFEENAPAIALYTKHGFVEEGRRREAVKKQIGYQDIIWMGKLL